LVNSLIGLIGKDIICIIRGTINETKFQTKTEENYREVTNYLTANKTCFYTYQLKSSKGLQVELKGIDAPKAYTISKTETGRYNNSLRLSLNQRTSI